MQKSQHKPNFGTTQAPSRMQKRIIIVEDEGIIAASLKSTLTRLDYQVVGHAMNGDRALDLFTNTPCELVLLDINIQGTLSGIDLAKVIRKKHNIPFIFLTSFSDHDTLNKAKETVPYGYIVKPFTEHDLRSNIEVALFKFQSEQDQQDFSQSFVENKFQVNLTQREYDVLHGLFQGMSYKEVAAYLEVSVNTIKVYQKRLYQLFDVNSKQTLLKKLVS